jgi:hypothetical protein
VIRRAAARDLGHQGGGHGRVDRVHLLDDAGDAGSCELLVSHDRGPAEGAAGDGVAIAVTR